MGSVVLDELLRRYLVFIALRKFRALSVSEAKQYALLAVYRVVEKYGLEGMSVDEFWEWVRPGETYSRARLLPDTEEGHDYHSEQATLRKDGGEGEETVVLRTVDNVKTLTRKVLIRLILEDLRGEAKHDRLRKVVTEENAPSAWRSSPGDGDQQQLDDILRHLREERAGAEVAAARFVMRRVEERMDEPQRRIIYLLLDGHTPRELAAELEVDVVEIYNIYREYKSACRTLWGRLSSHGP